MIIFLLGSLFFLAVGNIPGYSEIINFFTTQLTKVEPVRVCTSEIPLLPDRVIYVLGGSQTSLEERFKTAANLYGAGLAKRVLVLSTPGITEYDPDLHRNLTNDEWCIKQLTRCGVQPGDIETVVLPKGIFGTLTEASGLAEIASQRGYREIILVTSRFHTRRTWMTFSKLFEERPVTLAIYAAYDPVDLESLLKEYFKFILYKKILLPNSSKQKPVQKTGLAVFGALSEYQGFSSNY